MEEYKYPEPLKKEWVREGITPDIVKWAESFGKFLCANDEDINEPLKTIVSKKKAMTTGQLRKFFGEVKRIDADVIKNKADIPMLKPLLAYAVGRDKNKAGKNKTRIEEFEKEMRIAIENIRHDSDSVLKSDYKNFVQIFESIVAYHKYYGGQENNN